MQAMFRGRRAGGMLAACLLGLAVTGPLAGLCMGLVTGLFTGPAMAQAPVPEPAQKPALDIRITYLRQEVEAPPVLSNLDPIPEDLGLAGARLALKDSATTGRFLGHAYRLDEVSVPPGGDFLGAARQVLGQSGLILVDAPAEALLALADLPEAQAALLVDVARGEGRLRSADCRANVLHTAVEDAARADALMQTLAVRRWMRLALITGPRPEDQAWAADLRHAAAKFGLKILAEKPWTFDTDLRRATGTEITSFTRDLPDHDVLLVADAADDFARYVPDNTALPRPVAGSAGLVPMGWSPALEQWGAVQLQERFEAASQREMAPRDNAAWLGVRAIAEAVTRSGSADPQVLRARMLAADFTLDGFKGRKLSFRPWNGQLRQPIAVANPRALVELAPLEGYLHQRNEMDSLGLDAPESACRAFDGRG